HASATMMDYPVIADVDNDDHAEIIVCHAGYTSALSVYGDLDDSWAPAREVWNQHAYDISNINDDLTLPSPATPGFADSNTWHSGVSGAGSGLTVDLEAEIAEVCIDECDAGVVYVTLRARNRSEGEIAAGLSIALYATISGTNTLIATTTAPAIPSAYSTEGITLTIDAADLDGAEALVAIVDDDGTGTGVIEECSEQNNDATFSGPFCESP
ncbi:MAG: hypothetical protein ACI8RZ_007759, partial [Myxococcota bacterium]